MKGLLIAIGMACLAAGGSIFVAGRQTLEWPVAAGQLQSSYTVRFGAALSAKAGNTDVYVPRVRYRYVVGGREFWGRRIMLFDLGYGTRQQVFHQLRGMQPGDAVQVHYDPNAPERSVLIAGAAIETVTLLLMLGAASLTLGLLLSTVGKWLFQYLSGLQE